MSHAFDYAEKCQGKCDRKWRVNKEKDSSQENMYDKIKDKQNYQYRGIYPGAEESQDPLEE